MLCVRLLCDEDHAGWRHGYGGAKSAFLSAGLQISGRPIDDEGMVLSSGATSPRMIYTSPSHQYPLGGDECDAASRAAGLCTANGKLDCRRRL